MKSGKGFLRQCVIYDPHSHGLIHSLCWQDVPLIRFWSEAGCPTCAEFVYSGFAEDEQGAARFLSARKLELPVVWPGISLIPISAFYSTDTIRLLPPRWKGDRSKHWCSARQPILMMSNKPWYFLAGNVCTKQSCNTTYQNSPRAKHYRPAHGRVSALISTSAHPKPGQAPHLPVDGAKPNAASRCFFWILPSMMTGTSGANENNGRLFSQALITAR